jgi:murein DD-endopeptidase MepM/ murein hydrolase activator NlpD
VLVAGVGLTAFLTLIGVATLHSAPEPGGRAPTPALVLVPAPHDTAAEAARKAARIEVRLAYAAGTVETGLFDDALHAGMSEALVARLAEIFAWDVDFARSVQPGDSFAVVYEERYWLGQKVADGAILAAELVSGGQTYRAIAHRDRYGYSQYYTPEGLSLRRMFLRAPLEYTRISSGYTLKRLHPILKSVTAHRGIDYAAPSDTPVRSTATGRILAIGRDGGYGNRVAISHGGVYSTLYAHLSRFAPGLRAGSLVEQGQIVGYVGATGLATGPHLHYEFQVNGAHRDPLRFAFPGATPIAPEGRAEFERNARLYSAQLDRISPQIRLAAAR